MSKKQAEITMEEAPLLSKDAIIAANDIKTELVEVPEWGGAVMVTTLSGTERDNFESEMILVREDGTREQNLKDFRAKLCSKTMINAKGRRLFPNIDDVEALGKKSSLALDRIMKVAQRLNGIGQKDVEELTKN